MSTLRDGTANKRNDQDKSSRLRAFGDRITHLLEEKSLSQAELARLCDEPKSKINAYANGERYPQADTAIALAEALGVTAEFLITGTEPVSPIENTVPILDVRLAAGAGRLPTAELVTGYMTLDEELMKQIGRTTTKGLVVMTGEGDSNEPLIRDGSPILIDETDKHIRDGFFYAFRLGDSLRIKRLRYVVTDVEASSVNPLYPPEIIPYDMRDQFEIIGRALWTGTRL